MAKKLRVSVYDYDFGLPDDYIGETLIDLTRVCKVQKEKKSEWHSLKPNKTHSNGVTDHVGGHETPPSPYSHSHSSSHNPTSSSSVSPSHSPPRSANSSPQPGHKRLTKKPQTENKEEDDAHEDKENHGGHSPKVSRKAHDVLFGGAKSKTEKELDLLGMTPQELDRFKNNPKAFQTMGAFQAEPKPVMEHHHSVDKKDEEEKEKKDLLPVKAPSKAQDLLYGGSKSKKQKKLEKLGMTQSEFVAFQKNPGAYQKFVLTGGGIDHKVQTDEQLGDISVCIWYNKLIDRLNVEVIEAHHLPAMDSNGLSDPFVKIYLNPDPKKKNSSCHSSDKENTQSCLE